MKTLKIFLASSNELQTEREMMAALANSLNTVLEKQGVNVIVVQWENLDASMGVNHKQEDYNEKLRECDICMVLYWTKFGMYTKIELETAFNELKAGHNPKKVYVYFKEDDSKVSDELKDFRDSFPTQYGHFYTPFSNFDTLKAHFLLQFMEHQSQILPAGKGVEVRNGKVTIDGTDYVDLKNVPFAGNNEEYQLLQKNIKKTQKLLALTETDDPDYSEYAKDLNEMKEKLAKMESSLWDTALMITRLSTTKCSERLERAMQLFNKGDNKGALAVLNEEEIEKDAQHNINLIKLGETGREGLQTNIQEFEMRISSLLIDRCDGWLQENIRLNKKILEWTEVLYGAESIESGDAATRLGYAFCYNCEYSEALLSFTQAMGIKEIVYGMNHAATAWAYSDMAMITQLKNKREALEYSLKAMNIMEDVRRSNHQDKAKMYNNIAVVYKSLKDYDKALEYYYKAVPLLEDECDFANVYSNIATLNQRLGNFDKAIEYGRKAVEIGKSVLDDTHPDLAHLYRKMGGVYEACGDFANALEYSFKALTIGEKVYGVNHPKTVAQYRSIGRIYHKSENLDKAEYYLSKAANQDDAKALNLLSYVFFKKGDYVKSMEAIDRAIALRPSYPNFIDTKGEHLFNLGRYDEAKEMWMEVIKLDLDLDKHVDSALYKGLKSKGLI